MNISSKVFRYNLRIAILLIIFIALPLSPPATARDIIGLSGSFYRQIIETPQNSVVQGPSIYVTIFNQGDRDVNIRMGSDVPFGVIMEFSSNNFDLNPGDQQKVDLTIKVGKDALPGEYTIKVIAEAYASTAGSGVQMVHSVAQEAKLKVSGTASSLKVRTISADGTPIASVVRLYKVVEGQYYEVAYDEAGNMQANVTPGEFIAVSYIAGEKLTEQKFTVSDPSKTIDLVLNTIYFESFDIVPNYREGTREISYVQLVYSLKNLYKPFNNVNLALLVNYNEAPLQPINLLQTSKLETGKLSLSYNYTPVNGWKPGLYKFKIIMVSEGKEAAYTRTEQIEIAKKASSGMSSTMIIVISAVAVVLIAVLIFIMTKRKKTEKIQ